MNQSSINFFLYEVSKEMGESGKAGDVMINEYTQID